MSYEQTGVVSLEEIQLPSKERAAKAPFAIIECPQEIPCDPCVKACKSGAITKKSLIAPPKIDFDKCTGCGACIPKCPGLAIFVVDLSKKSEAILKIPYEFELPKVNGIVKALDREGKVVGKARVARATKGKDKTGIVAVELKKELALAVRNIRRIK